MTEKQHVIYQSGEAEIVEKKSRFIGQVFAVRSEEDALARLAQIRKKHWGARHHCFAFVCGDRNEQIRFSDDGEPQGTAGKPILEVLKSSGLHDAMIVVTRYFGGTLLGTGGLVRAYTQAAKAGLEACVIIEKLHGKLLEISAAYTDLGKLQYLLGKRHIPPVHTEYTDTVSLQILVADDQADALKKEITEATGGRAGLRDLKSCYFAEIDGTMQELP